MRLTTSERNIIAKNLIGIEVAEDNTNDIKVEFDCIDGDILVTEYNGDLLAYAELDESNTMFLLKLENDIIVDVKYTSEPLLVEEIIDTLEGSQFTLKNLEKAFNSKGVVIMCGVNDDIICWDSREEESALYSLYLDDNGIIVQVDYEGK